MAKIKIDASTTGTGTFTISAPNSNTDRTLTLPDTTAALVTTASPDFTGDVTFDTSTLVIDSTNNRVGIGTTSPEQNLHIKRASGSDTLGEGHVLLDVADDNGPAWALRIGDTGDDGDFHIDRRTGGSWGNGLSIDRLTGSVGIGTTSPNERLSVVAASDSSHYDNGFSIYRSIGDDKVTINAQGGGAKFIADGGSGYIPYRFYGHNGSNTAEWLTISSDGYVGIGESSPTAELDVTGGIVASQSYRIGDISHWKMRGNNANTDLAFEYATSSSLADANIKMVLKSSGRVGIGTTSPDAALEVSGGSNNQFKVSSTGSEANITLEGVSYGQFSNAVGDLYITNETGSNIYLRTSSTTRMTIDSSGRATIPYQPSFHAYGTGNYSASSGSTKVDFAGTIHNVGSHYSTTNSRFTAPVAGRYLFSFMLRIDSANTDYFRTYVRKNGSASYRYGHQIQDWGTNWDPRYASMTGTVIYQLAANDYVELAFDSESDTSVTIYQTESSFYGCLLY